MKSIDSLKSTFRGSVLIGEPLRNHTSFKIGGPAEIFLMPESKRDLIAALKWARQNKLPIFVIGNGTNIIVSDDGIEGVVIGFSKGFNKLEFFGNRAVVEAGVNLQGFLEEATKRNLGGLEFAWGIPGAVGGSIVMNAGSNSHFISTKVEQVTVMSYDGKEYTLSHDELKFNYRYSILQDEPLVLVEAFFVLDFKDSATIMFERDQNLKARWAKQPLNLPCAGSVFKNPPTTYAGKVIEEVGCKGMKIGDAMISEKHANFIVNLGNATASDVIALIREVRKKVYKQKDLILDLEIKLVGNFRESDTLENLK